MTKQSLREMSAVGLAAAIRDGSTTSRLVVEAHIDRLREAEPALNAIVQDRYEAALADAGAIPLGVTNISELTLWIESDNRVYGRAKNAYDDSRTAGGSSGGEGASIGGWVSPDRAVTRA